jgi:Holliday junction resolvase
LPNKHYLRGRRLEWQVKKDLEAEGWQVFRTAGSHGKYDLIAIRKGDLRLIQCKSVDSDKNGYKYFRDFDKNTEKLQSIVKLRQELIIKVKGNKNYAVYPLENT